TQVETMITTAGKPDGITVDGAGNAYVVDADWRIGKLAMGATMVTPFAGDIAGMFNGYADGAALTTARFRSPGGLALDAMAKNLYIADEDNHAIRKLDLQTNIVSTLAGTPPPN